MTESETRTSFLPANQDSISWQEVLADVAAWRPVVAAICKQTDCASGDEIASGFPGTCAVFIVDEQVVVKIFPPFLADDFKREKEAYRLMGDNLHPFVPNLIVAGTYRDQADWPFIVLSFLSGVAIREIQDEIDPASVRGLAQELGWLLHELHSVGLDNANATIFDIRPSTWQAFIDERSDACLKALSRSPELPPAVIRETQSWLGEVFGSVTDDFRPCLLNGDLTEDHLLLTNRLGQWRISGLIDWADALVGSVYYEWVALWFGLCRQNQNMFRAILRAYDPQIRFDKSFRQEMMAHTLVHRFGPDIIGDMLKRPGAPKVKTLTELQMWLWPPMLD